MGLRFFFVLENVICIFVNVVNKELETNLQYIDIYLYNKNILKYGLLLVGSGRLMIFHIEGHSNTACSSTGHYL